MTLESNFSKEDEVSCWIRVKNNCIVSSENSKTYYFMTFRGEGKDLDSNLWREAGKGKVLFRKAEMRVYLEMRLYLEGYEFREEGRLE